MKTINTMTTMDFISKMLATQTVTKTEIKNNVDDNEVIITYYFNTNIYVKHQLEDDMFVKCDKIFIINSIGLGIGVIISGDDAMDSNGIELDGNDEETYNTIDDGDFVPVCEMLDIDYFIAE